MGIYGFKHSITISHSSELRRKLEIVLMQIPCRYRTARLFDCTTENNYKQWKVDGEVEKVLWNHFNPFTFLVRFVNFITCASRTNIVL